MPSKPRSSDRRQRLVSFALLGCACAALPLRSARGQGTAESATVLSNGVNNIESGGAYPTSANGSNRYLDVGAGYKFPSFSVLDFSVGSYGLNYSVASVSNLTLSLTEANTSTTRSGSFTIYLTEDTASVATANGGSPLTYQSAAAPGGLGTQLGDSSTLFTLGTFTSSAATSGTASDAYGLTLSSAAQTYFLSQLNGGSANDLRLVIVSNDSTGYGTYNGNTSTGTSAVPPANQPTFSFNAVLNLPTLAWKPGGAAGGSGTWLPAGTAGDTSWNGGAWDSSKVAQFNSTGGNVTIGTGGVSATGIQFNTTGYTVGTTTGPAITLTSSNGAPPTVQVSNATDTATINAPIAGTMGMNKTGAGTLVLGANNTFMGGTTISGGTLQIGADANLGDVSNGVALAGGTLHPVGSQTLARNFTGSGAIQVDSGSTLNVSGVVNASNLTLPNSGTLALTNTSGSLANNASNAVSGTLTFNTANTTLTTADYLQGSGVVNGNGIITLGGVTAAQTSGTVTLAANANLTGTVTANVANSGATLNLPGSLIGGASLFKSGAGTLVLGGDNSNLSGSGGASFRQGTAGATPGSGGIISIPATNPNPGAALGTSGFFANGGTLSNDTGTAVTLQTSAISLGAQNSTNTPGGLVFSGSGANPSITFTGAFSLYKGASTAYQHQITVNVPTTFTGLLTASATATTSTGLTIAGSSTLTLQGSAANTLFEPITLATSGANAGVIAASDGTFAATTAITFNAGARLTLKTGNTINDAALLSFQSAGMTNGQLILNNTTAETVGGIYLAVGDGYLAAGYQAAGTYGAPGSGATNIDPNLFGGGGILNDLANTTAVPEPSTWTALAGGLLLLAWLGRRRLSAPATKRG